MTRLPPCETEDCSTLVIVPNALRDAINRKLDAAFRVCPEAEKDREVLYHSLLEHFNEYGDVPDFTLRRKGVPRDETTGL